MVSVVNAHHFCVVQQIFARGRIQEGKNVSRNDIESGMVERSLEIGKQFLLVLSVFFPFLYFLYILRAGVQGLGKGVISMISSGVQLVMRIGCAFLLTRSIGYAGLFWGEVSAWLGAGLLLFIFFRKRICIM